MNITFIRHSKTFVEPEKPIVLWGLAQEGIEKAKQLAEDERIKNLDVIYSSLQTKAVETMVYLAKPNAIPMRTDKDLTELTSFTNKFYTGEEYTRQIEQYYDRTLDRIAGGETIEEGLNRFLGALSTIVEMEKGANNIGVVTHGYILSFISGKYADADPFELHRTITQPDVAIMDWDKKAFTSFWGM